MGRQWTRARKPHEVSYGVIQGDKKRTVVSFDIEMHKTIRRSAIADGVCFSEKVRQLVEKGMEK
jgi:hypothetical protein